MKCLACGIDQPARFQRCFFCGEDFTPTKNFASAKVSRLRESIAMPVRSRERLTQSEDGGASSKQSSRSFSRSNPPIARSADRQLPTLVGGLIISCVLLISAGATIFFLTRPSDDQALLRQAEHELSCGQYAFAVKTLKQATSSHPKDGKAFLALARAYLGIDQLDKAYDCISRAKQLGVAVATDYALASQLAKYYQQKGRFDQACDLLRPLAQADIPGEKAQLADLDALWGDECLRHGQADEALRLWQQVADLKAGSRFGEANLRLATIYEKLADAAFANDDDNKALDYLNKLNSIAASAKSYQLIAEIDKRGGKLEPAVAAMRQACQLEPHNRAVSRQMANLLNLRGKELIEANDLAAGYACMQEAKSFDPLGAAPACLLRSLHIGLADDDTHCPFIKGEVFNPAFAKAIDSLTMRVELWDLANEKMLWTKQTRLVDQYSPPLAAGQSRSFAFTATAPFKADSAAEFRVYLDDVAYQTYPVGGTGKSWSNKEAVAPKSDSSVSNEQSSDKTTNTDNHGQLNPQTSPSLASPEEKTMKDLDY